MTLDIDRLMRDLPPQLRSRLITQPPRMQARMKELKHNGQPVFDLIREQVETVAGTRPQSHGQLVAPSGALGKLPPDAGEARAWFARPLLRACHVEFHDPDGQPWQKGSDVSSVAVQLVGTSTPHVIASITSSALEEQVLEVSLQSDPPEDHWKRLVSQHVFVDTHVAFACGLDKWLEKHDPAPGGGPTNWTALALDVTARVTSELVLLVKGLTCVDRPTSSRFDHPALKALLSVPSYSAYPGGHAALAAAYQTIIAHLGVDKTSTGAMAKVAADITDNRRIARLHTRFDNSRGTALGKAIGAALLTPAAVAACPTWGDLLVAAAKEWV